MSVHSNLVGRRVKFCEMPNKALSEKTGTIVAVASERGDGEQYTRIYFEMDGDACRMGAAVESCIVGSGRDGELFRLLSEKES